ncbi:hypothetical protein FB007_12671 [Sinorhizobium medicae]|nr:hypothetical protein FB007_12671 [Sinorhizobium medicae]
MRDGAVPPSRQYPVPSNRIVHVPASAFSDSQLGGHPAMYPKLDIQPKYAERLLWGILAAHVNV